MKKAQASLELVISFLVVLSLFLGIIGIWVWGNRQMAWRQPAFNNTREMAGTPYRSPGSAGNNKPVNYPIWIGGCVN